MRMAEQPDMPDRSGIVVGCELASQLEPRCPRRGGRTPDMPDRSGIVVGCELASQLEPRALGAVATPTRGEGAASPRR